jgi:hypothetical protein
MRNTMKIVFPRIFCVEDLQCKVADKKGYDYRATLYHDQACITVSFNSLKRVPDLLIGRLAQVRWLPTMHSNHGAIQVAGLTLHNAMANETNSRNFNPFKIVPHTFCVDRHLVNCARDLWDISSKEMRQLLFDTVLAKAMHTGLQH